MILLTGATGANGREIARLLAQRGVPFRAMVRDANRAADIAALPGAQIVAGDFEKSETLNAALVGVETAFLLCAPDPRQAELQSNFVEAAKRASRMRHMVHFSAIGASPESPFRFGRIHGQTEEQIKSSRLKWTILRPNSFMQNWLAFAPAVKQTGTIHDPLETVVVSYVDVRDIARVAAAVLTDPAAHEGKSYEITGPAALAGAHVADALSQATGKTIGYQAVPLDAFVQGAKASGVPPWQADGLGGLYAWLAQGNGAAVTNTIRDVTGKMPARFAAWARENAPAFTEEKK